jgi:DNA polymerase-1
VQLLDEYHKIFSDGYTELARMFQNRHGIENINSPIQVSKWLFKDLKLAPIKYTKNKNKKTPSTDKDVIEAYAAKYPDVRKLYEARRLANLLSYFLPSIKEHLDPEDIIHPKLKHYGIQSFRLSCSAPNLHGIPRDKTKIEILDKYPLRRLFVARHPDSFIVEFDYSQQEVRIVAELANDVNLLAAFARGDDPHRFVASLVFHKPQDQITEFERQVAKGCVFGAIFGVSARELAIRLRIKESDAQLYLDEFFRLFPSIKKYIERQHDIMLRNGLIVSILGQPRRFVIHQNNINECKREAANHTIQSPAAGITFLSLINVHDKLIQDGVLSKTVYLCNSIHDSLLTDVRRESLEYAVKEIPAIMSSIPKKLGFKVDFPVEAKIGRRWGENIKLEEALKN